MSGEQVELLGLIESTLSGLGSFSTASAAHGAAERALREVGLKVAREVGLAVDGRRSRLDLVASSGSARAGIELDRLTPRRKSLSKLRAFDGGRVVVLREGRAQRCPAQIDALVLLAPA